MASSPVLARLGAIGSLIALLIVSAAGAAPPAPASASSANGASMPGTLIPLYASQQDSFTRVAPARQRPRSVSAATINVTYSGFSPQAQAAFQYAVDLWEPLLTSAVPIEIQANWTALPPGVLGSAGPSNFYRDWPTGTPAPKAGHWYPSALASKLSGVDRDPTSVDINANFSSSFPNWYFSADGNTPAGQYDFVSVVLHEIGHGLGFVGSATVSSGDGSWGQGTGLPFIYDITVENAGGTAIIDSGAFANPSAALAAQLQGDALYWDGPAALAANGGQRPRLYAPATWTQGSSYSHLDEAAYPAGNANSLMTPQIGAAESIHDPGAITLGMFSDMGWETHAPIQASIEIETTVGLDPAACAATDSITVAPNTQVFYCFMVTNTGAVTLTDHMLVDDQLGTVLNNFPYMLFPGTSAFMTATDTIAATTANVATWTASNGSFSATDSDGALVTVSQSIDLAIAMSSPPATIQAGTQLTYAITVTNSGASPASTVVMSDTLPAGVTVASMSTTHGICSLNDVTCSIASLPAGASAVISLVANTNQALAPGSQLTNTAMVSTQNQDPTPGNNSASVTTAIGGGRVYLPLVANGGVRSIAQLSSAPIATRPAAYVGEIFYTATVALPATLPSGGHFYLSSSPSGPEKGMVDDKVVLRDGAATIFSYNYRMGNHPAAQLMEIPRSTLAPFAGQPITINFVDVSGGQISATPLYLIWAP